MLDIDVSRLRRPHKAFAFSRSQAEAGPTAGPDSWHNAMVSSRTNPCVAADEVEDVRNYYRGFGAWDDAEIDQWDRTHCSAMVLQEAAGDLREAQAVAPGRGTGFVDWDKYQAFAESGRCSGRIYATGRKLFMMIGD